MNAQLFYLGKARTWICSLTFAVSVVLLSFFSVFAQDGDFTCVTDTSHKGIELGCDKVSEGEEEFQYAVIEATQDFITFDVAMPFGVNKEGMYGECQDVNIRRFSRTGPACNVGNLDLYPRNLVSEYADMYNDAVLAINGDLFGSIDLKHGAEGLTIVNGVRVDGGLDKYGNNDGGPVGDDDGNGYLRPSTIIRGDGQEIDIAERSLLGIQQLTESLNSTLLIEAMGGCPLLVENGVVRVDIVEKTNSLCSDVGARSEVERTAIGVMPDGKLVVVVHPRINLLELADWFQRFGVKNAINLDGGGSTQMWFKPKSEEGKTIFSSNRPVANALVISHTQEDIPETCFRGLPDIACVLFDYLPPVVTNFYTTYLGGNQVASASMNAVASGGIATVTAEGVADEGGSGTNFVEFSAKWSGQDWRSIGIIHTAPFEVNWNMCEANVPDGDIEFGMIVQDHAGNRYVWSEHHPNPHVQKSFNCNPNQGGNNGAVKLYANKYYSGAILWSQNTGFSNEPNAEGYSLSMPDGWSVKVWSNDGKKGSEKCFSKGIHNLQDYGWNNKIQSMEVYSNNVCGDAQIGYVVVCTDSGSCTGLYPGYYHLDDYDLRNNIVRVDAVPSNMSIMLFRNDLMQGTMECYNHPRDVPSGWPWDLRAEASSAFVFSAQNCPAEQHSSLLFYSGSSLEGHSWSAGRGPGFYNMDGLGSNTWFNNEAESFLIPPGKSAYFYAEKDLGGENTSCLTGVNNELGNWANKISSVELFDNENCKPKAPINLQAAPLSPNSIQVWWEHSQAADFGFKVYRWNGSTFAEIGEVERGTTSFIDNSAQCAAEYFYKVSAKGRQESTLAGWVAVTTHSCPQPARPKLNSYEPLFKSENDVFTLEWLSVEYASDYKARLRNNDNEFDSGFTAATMWTVRDLPPGSYSLDVAVRGRGGENISLPRLVRILPAAPDLIDAQPVGCDAVGLYWRNNSSSGSSFEVYRDGEIIATVFAQTGKNYYSLLDESREALTIYNYVIRTEANGQFSESFIEKVFIPACEEVPTVPTLTSPASNAEFDIGEVITFTWTGDAKEYVVYLGEAGAEYPYFELTDMSFQASFNEAGAYSWYILAFNGELSAISEKRKFVVKGESVLENKIFLPLVTR